MATLQGDYEPSPSEWVRDQVAEYEESGGARANTLLDTGMPIIVVTSRGAKSGNLRKNPVMRVVHDGAYALVASKGGAPENPEWFYNLVAYPDEVVIQDGPEPFAVTVLQIEGDERATWWERAVAAYPPYSEYQERTDRRIPVFLATRAGAGS
jgi:deazaflavin-dependent oxidoreductase (nitroreductase family)